MNILLLPAVVKAIQKNQRECQKTLASIERCTLNKMGDLRSLRSWLSYLGMTILLFASSSNALHAQYAMPVNGVATPPAPPIVTAPTGVYVQTNVDPASGRQVDIYLEHEAVPVLKWEQQEVTERRFVPQWVHETQKTTEVQYIPSVTYQTQAKNLNAWNPLLPPRIAYEYIPVTQYQTVNQVVDKPITYQKYVDQDVKVIVPKLVQVTEQRAKYTQRERNAPGQVNGAVANANQATLKPMSGPSGQPSLSPEQQSAQLALANRNTLSTSYVTRPVHGAGNTPAYPFSSYAAKTTRATASMPQGYYAWAPYSPQTYPQQTYPPAGYAPGNYTAAAGYQPNYTTAAFQQPAPQQYAPQQYAPWGQNTTVAMIPNSYPTSQPYYGGYPNSNPNPNPTYAQSWFQMPSWMTGNGPLLSQNIMRPSTYSSYNPNSPMTANGNSAQPVFR